MSFGIPVRNGLAVGLLASTFLTSRRSGGPFSGAALYLNMLSGSLDSRVTFTRASTATFVGSNGLIQTAAIDAPRFDYNPVTLAPLGLLIEEARTNLLTYSEQLGIGAGAWPTANVSITSNSTTAPDGTLTADTMTAISTGAFRYINQALTLTNGVTYTLTVYLKYKTARYVWLLGETSSDAFAIFDLLTGTAGSVSAGVTRSITPAGNGWYRCTATFTVSSATASQQVGFGLSDTDTVVSPSATAGIDTFLWGAQLEAGSFATSYIPTVASQVTRNADVATMTGTNFSSWYNQPEGTFVADFDDYSGIANFANIYLADDGTVNNRICILKNNSNTSIRFEVTTAGSGQALLGTTIGSAVNPTRHASTYKDNDFAACANGGTVATDGAGTVPSGINILRLGRDTAGAAGNLLNGHIRQIAYFNSRLPNAQLQALTAPPLITSLSLDFINGVYEG